ncbi:hypothetical protein [Streptomyces sp. NBC_01239]|uniref:hypothetical protein n=1 Tax=Streptomyces sp. NBC_01239 TaxID=2903792 RepID=UPI002B1D7141|nr:hypothetical protein [Streptomyces sp. NBC_01239]
MPAVTEVTTPGVELGFEENGRHRTACMAHADGSWARARAEWLDPPEVHQDAPRRLWDQLERIRNRLNAEGCLPLYGSTVEVTRGPADYPKNPSVAAAVHAHEHPRQIVDQRRSGHLPGITAAVTGRTEARGSGPGNVLNPYHRHTVFEAGPPSIEDVSESRLIAGRIFRTRQGVYRESSWQKIHLRSEVEIP